MSAQPKELRAPELVRIEIDGRALEVPKGAMVIQAADAAGIPIPRFCYHKKLSIAANCRMCLVDVEKAPKPLPACATPVAEGMRVYTRSRRALDAQRGVMEFLLINHPLDCPICDQGGECELQDLAMGYGRSVSRFTERKRVVPDEDLGPLVATDMTRCIHCTRCVRFLEEIAGTCELGGMGRGEHLEIGTYIGRALESELSANVIDLCPVGALTNKPFRFRARPWELIARPSIGYHDCLGSNLWLHVRRREVMRAVPRENEAINESWLADRDRFSHLGLGAEDRLPRPMLREQGRLREATLEEALGRAAAILAEAGPRLGLIAHPSATCEEAFLLQALARGLGARDIDHRLRERDFRDDPRRASEPRVDRPLAAIPQARRVLLIGSHPRWEQPLLGHRLRQAWRRGAEIFALRALALPTTYGLARDLVVPTSRWPELLAAVLAGAEGKPASGPGAAAEAEARAIGQALAAAGGEGLVILGDQAAQHGEAALLRALAARIAAAAGAGLNEIPQGPNGRGGWRYGLLPHRLPHGRPAPEPGRDLAAMLAEPPPVTLWFNAEAPADFADGAGALGLLGRSRVVAFAAFLDPALAAHAEVLLPIALLPENEGSYLNHDGTAQDFAAAVPPPGEARPAWRLLRALGERLGLAGFDWLSLAELRERMAAPPEGGAAGMAEAAPDLPSAVGRVGAGGGGLERIATVPIYGVDAVVRRAAALQATPLGGGPFAALHPEEAQARGLAAARAVRVRAGAAGPVLPLRLDPAVPRGAVWVPAAGEAATLPWDAPLAIEEAGEGHG